MTWQALGTSGVVTITCTADDPPGPHVPTGDTGTRNDEPPGSAHVTVTVCVVDLDVDGVADEDEITKGKYLLFNNDDDNTNSTADRLETGPVTDEDDLAKLTLQQVQPSSWNGNVTLSATGSTTKIKVWSTATKGTQVGLPATYSNSDLPKELWAEGYGTSGAPRDVGLKLSITVDSTTCEDEVKFTVVVVAIKELGFTSDHMISEWPSGTKIDDPDGSAPVWKKDNNPNKPVSHTKNTNVTMFGKFAISPTLSDTLTGVGIRAKKNTVVFARKDNVSLTGDLVDVTGIAGTTPLETTVKAATPPFTWQISLDGGTSWASSSLSGPHTMYWVYDTPHAATLYDLALSKACGYQGGGTADLATVLSNICTGMDGNISYWPYGCTSHTLDLFSRGYGQCCCHATVFELLAESVCSTDAVATYIWGGHSSSYLCKYTYSGWTGPSFRVLKPAHDDAEANPHFKYHVETLANGTYYDPSYGSTGLIELNETALAHDPYPAASRQTGAGWTYEHATGWTCPH